MPKESLIKTVSLSMLTTIASGFLYFLWLVFIDITSLKARVNELNNDQEHIEKKIDEIHWYLIRRKKVEVPE